MDHKTRQSYAASKKWLVLTVFIFAISYIMMQILYIYADKAPDFDMKLLTVSYIIPIVLCLISLTLMHFQMLRIGAFVGILVGINLITNIALTDIIIKSTETLMTLFEPIFSILPILNSDFGIEQFNLICNIVSIVQILYGVFLIIVNIKVLFKNDRTVFNHI